MRLTRRAWGVVLCGLVLVTLGLLVERAVALVGAGLLGGWLVAVAVGFVGQLDRTVADLSVEQSIEHDRVVAGRPVAITLAAGLARPTELHLDVRTRAPASASLEADEPNAITIPVGADQARTSYIASWPHAGSVRFDPPIVTATDAFGLFESSLAIGSTPELTVAPRAPRDVHVGVGGQPVTGAYGDHAAGRRGGGLEPAELREYIPGDAANRIDWKATARLAEPFIREFEVETERRTLLVIDHRAAMGRGPADETKLDYLREVALAYLETARAFDDPFGCLTVGDEGLTGRWLPKVDRQQFAAIGHHVGSLEPTTGRAAAGPRAVDPAAARGLADRLSTDDSAFGATLRPYFDHAPAYLERIEDEVLYRAARSVVGRVRKPLWTVVLTDDTQPAVLKQAVSVARRGGGRVLVYLTPSALFEPGGLGDLETAYDRYVEFEDLRRSIVAPDRVDAFEVAPGDRLDAVLTAGRRLRSESPRRTV